MGTVIASLAVGETLPQRKFDVTLANVVRYAGASGDFNPLHHDEAAARAAGMPGAFAHGMFSAGCLATAITDAVGIQALQRFAVRFRGQAMIGKAIASHVEVSALQRVGDGVVAELDCRLVDDDEAVVVTGSARVAGPRASHPQDPTHAGPAATGGVLGVRLQRAVVVVERGPAQFFAIAVGDDSAVYRSAEAAAAAGLGGIQVPPTYAFAIPNWGTFADQQPPRVDDAVSLVELMAMLRNGRKGVILHGEQEFTYFSPIHVGDTVWVEGFVESVEEKPGVEDRPGMTVMVVRTDYRDAVGDLLTVARSTYLFRPATR